MNEDSRVSERPFGVRRRLDDGFEDVRAFRGTRISQTLAAIFSGNSGGRPSG